MENTTLQLALKLLPWMAAIGVFVSAVAYLATKLKSEIAQRLTHVASRIALFAGALMVTVVLASYFGVKVSPGAMLSSFVESVRGHSPTPVH